MFSVRVRSVLCDRLEALKQGTLEMFLWEVISW